MVLRMVKKIIIIVFVFTLCIETFASIVSDNDGSAFITKAEFEAMKKDFNDQIEQYNESISSKIDGAIASYLAGTQLARKENRKQIISGAKHWLMYNTNDYPKYVDGKPYVAGFTAQGNRGGADSTERTCIWVGIIHNGQSAYKTDGGFKKHIVGKPSKNSSLNGNDKAPILIKPGYDGGETNIMGNVSSQFISSILISSPLSKHGTKLYVLPEFKSKPYVNMTLDIMRKFGVKTLSGYYLKHESCDKEYQGCRIDEFIVRKQDYVACDYTVEGDYSSASYLLALIAINGGKAKIKNLFRDSKQGDKYILDILQKMGATIIRGEDYVEIASSGNLKAIDVDLSNAPDLLITVAVLAAMAEGTTNITGVAHARVKETDRIDTTCRELEKLDCKLTEREDGMSITGGVASGVVDSHGDHRLAMAFSLIGLKHDIEITNGDVFDVSFPNFIEAMAELGFELELKNE